MGAAGPVLTRPMTQGCVGKWYRSVSSGGQGLVVPEARMGALTRTRAGFQPARPPGGPQEMPRPDVRGNFT